METWKGLIAGGVALTLGGLLFQWAGLCPIVKRIWTSSYTLYSGGLVCLMLAALYFIIDVKGWKRWAFPLLVIGANSIVVYVMSGTIEDAVAEGLERCSASLPSCFSGRRSCPSCAARPSWRSSGSFSTGCIAAVCSCESDVNGTSAATTLTTAPGPGQVVYLTRTLAGNTRVPASVTPGRLSRCTSRSRGSRREDGPGRHP